ncbi:glycosyltransferase [Candidatus Finniella inopinata]|nr:cellulose synthase catalytic subunit [Candidatus Finniella inopinata]
MNKDISGICIPAHPSEPISESSENSFYFKNYEERMRPNPPIDLSHIQSVFRLIGIITIVFGGHYIGWRWLYSLNDQAPIFSLALITAETMAYFGLFLFIMSLWTEIPIKELEEMRGCIKSKRTLVPSVDIFIATYNEDPELVRLSIQDAKRVTYSELSKVNIYVLDDGNRPEMEKIAVEETVEYLSRQNNVGYKAGNLSNGLYHSNGEFIIVCDADTRLYPDFLEKTIGFFDNPSVAWVQTPQWFYDLHDGIDPRSYFKKLFPYVGKMMGLFVYHVFGVRQFLADPFLSDGTIFYDVILNRRNAHNASFCCGAGSIHRRTALLEIAKAYALSIGKDHKDLEAFRPFLFHISEDIYTSLEIHKSKKWISILYPQVLSKMLSPQDGLSRHKQLYRYALGTLDMAKKEGGILFKTGLTFFQRMFYFCTVYSYLNAIWSMIFFLVPIFYLFTEISPIGVSAPEVLKKLIPFLVANELLQMIAYWGRNTFHARVLTLGCFWIHLKALYSTIRKKPVEFDVTSKTPGVEKRFVNLVRPHLIIIGLSVLAIIWSITMVILGLSYSHIGILCMNYLWIICNLIILVRFVLGMIWTWEKEPIA